MQQPPQPTPAQLPPKPKIGRPRKEKVIKPKVPRIRKPRNPLDKTKKKEPVHVSTKIKITTAASGKEKKKEKLEELQEAPVEEHIILRLPPSPATQQFRQFVKKRRIPEGFSINFSDPRNAQINLGIPDSPSLSAKLVDLPCILESQKTFDNKQFYKIADICQMILVNDPKYPHPPIAAMVDKTGYPDGITPPLKSVRIRRFRKRMSKKAIEDVEKEVERLLQADLDAEDVKFGNS
jgi:transcription initiation factor TFIID subunit 7